MTNNHQSHNNYDGSKHAPANVRPFDSAFRDTSPLVGISAPDFSVEKSSSGQVANRILSDLPDEDFTRLFPHLESVSLVSGENLYGMGDDIRFAYFPESTVVSLIHILEDGSSTEATMIGREGVVGLPAIFGAPPHVHWTQVTIAGAALRVSIEALRDEFARGGALQQRILAYAGTRLAQLSQRAVCNSRHMLRERLCTWLLMVHDRMVVAHLPLTQEQIARHLGARRAGVSESAKALRDERIIDYSRGQIRIRDRRALEAAACECFRVAAVPDASRQRFA